MLGFTVFTGFTLILFFIGAIISFIAINRMEDDRTNTLLYCTGYILYLPLLVHMIGSTRSDLSGIIFSIVLIVDIISIVEKILDHIKYTIKSEMQLHNEREHPG